MVMFVASHRLGICAGVVFGSHKAIEAMFNVPLPGVSLLTRLMSCTVSYGPVLVSFVASGGGKIVGVSVLVAVWPNASVT